VIAAPGLGRLWVAKGPPHEHAFMQVDFSASQLRPAA
jgi:hypothetical protein